MNNQGTNESSNNAGYDAKLESFLIKTETGQNKPKN